jgi:hypothetical protein
MEPILSKLPDRDNFHFYFAEAPFVVSGMDSVPLDEKAQLQLKNRSKDEFSIPILLCRDIDNLSESASKPHPCFDTDSDPFILVSGKDAPL